MFIEVEIYDRRKASIRVSDINAFAEKSAYDGRPGKTIIEVNVDRKDCQEWYVNDSYADIKLKLARLY